MGKSKPTPVVQLDPRDANRIILELRHGATLARWTIAGTLVIGLTALGGVIASGPGVVVGFIAGVILGSLFGGIADATLQWMAESLMYQRALLAAGKGRPSESQLEAITQASSP